MALSKTQPCLFAKYQLASVSDTGYVSVHVQIRSKRPSWNVAQQVTHTIDGFQDPFNQISLNAQLGPNAQLSMNTSAILCYSNLFFFYILLWCLRLQQQQQQQQENMAAGFCVKALRNNGWFWSVLVEKLRVRVFVLSRQEKSPEVTANMFEGQNMLLCVNVFWQNILCLCTSIVTVSSWAHYVRVL